MFPLEVPLRVGDQFGEVLSRWGFNSRQQAIVLAMRENSNLHRIMGNGPLHARQRVPHPIGQPLPPVFLHVPIDIQLQMTRYNVRENLQRGVAPHPVGVGPNHPDFLPYGMDVCITRNMGPGAGLRWIQTVTRLHDHTHGRDRPQPTEYVDGALNTGTPWLFPHGPELMFTDEPSAPRRQGVAPGTDFEATATLAVLLGTRIILAAGITWGFTIIGSGANGVVPKPPHPSTNADLAKHLRILKAGVNVFYDPTGARLGYELAP